jgi:hypothetical protein
VFAKAVDFPPHQTIHSFCRRRPKYPRPIS